MGRGGGGGKASKGVQKRSASREPSLVIVIDFPSRISFANSLTFDAGNYRYFRNVFLE